MAWRTQRDHWWWAVQKAGRYTPVTHTGCEAVHDMKDGHVLAIRDEFGAGPMIIMCTSVGWIDVARGQKSDKEWVP